MFMGIKNPGLRQLTRGSKTWQRSSAPFTLWGEHVGWGGGLGGGRRRGGGREQAPSMKWWARKAGETALRGGASGGGSQKKKEKKKTWTSRRRKDPFLGQVTKKTGRGCCSNPKNSGVN